MNEAQFFVLRDGRKAHKGLVFLARAARMVDELKTRFPTARFQILRYHRV